MITDVCVNPTENSSLNKASNDKFILVLNLPTVIRGKIFDGRAIKLDPLQISVYGSVVPTVAVPSIAAPYGGQTYNVTSYTRPNYPPLVVNYVVDNTFYNYWVLWKWLSILNTPRGSVYGSNSDSLKDSTGIVEYQTNISVLGMNEYNVPTIEFKYYNCFITSLGGINYNYRESNMLDSTFEIQYSQFDVSLHTGENAAP